MRRSLLSLPTSRGLSTRGSLLIQVPPHFFLGKASLIVDPLAHKGKFYVGGYQLKVVPYFFKSENGMLELEASDDAVHKLLGGVAVKFIGKAANNKSGKPKVIIGKATPSSKDRGRVTFSIVTENGTMVFDTSYHFGE